MSCITKILEIKGERDFLVPSSSSHAVEGGGIYNGYKYIVTMTDYGHRCGYVAIPNNHTYATTYDYNELDIECHGGLTFMSDEHPLKSSLGIGCNEKWVGFDCGHCNDAVDTELVKKYFGQSVYTKRKSYFEFLPFEHQEIRDFDYVENECKSIIDQLIQVSMQKDNPEGL